MLCDGQRWLLARSCGPEHSCRVSPCSLPFLTTRLSQTSYLTTRASKEVIQEEEVNPSNITVPSALLCGLISQYVWSRYKGRGHWPHLLVLMSENLWTHLKPRDRKQLPVLCVGPQKESMLKETRIVELEP